MSDLHFIDSAIYLPDRESWREWLQENHDCATEVWLIFYKKHTGKPTIAYNEAVEESLCFGWIDSVKHRIDDQKYAQKFSPRKARSTWATSNKKRVARLIKQGLMTEAGMKLVEAAKQNGSWDKLPLAEQTIEMSEAFRAALEALPAAFEHFNELAPSYQREYIVWTASAKKEGTRERRIRKAMQLLEQNKKLGE